MKTEHIPYQCKKEGKECEYGCIFCDSDLFLCTSCGGAESSLTLECPGLPMTFEQQEAVSQANLDFKDGKWYNPKEMV